LEDAWRSAVVGDHFVDENVRLGPNYFALFQAGGASICGLKGQQWVHLRPIRAALRCRVMPWKRFASGQTKIHRPRVTQSLSGLPSAGSVENDPTARASAFVARCASGQSSFDVHSLREILKFLPPQHLQPALCAALAENCDVVPRSTVAEPLDIAGKHKTARGDCMPQSGQANGKSYSASGRKSANVPQRGHSYSYFGMLFL
jgi:hypothetical protein